MVTNFSHKILLQGLTALGLFLFSFPNVSFLLTFGIACYRLSIGAKQKEALMLGGILLGLFCGWVAGLFGFDTFVISNIQVFFETVEITKAHYYLMFVLGGIIQSIISRGK